MNNLLQNKVLLGVIAGVLVLVIILAIVFAGGKDKTEKKVENEKLKTHEERVLLTTDNLGKALEVQ